MANVFAALSDPTRRHILQLLKSGPMGAGEIAEHFPIAKSTLSAHFAILREAGLVGSEKSGKTITYWLNATVLEEALLAFASALDLNLMHRRTKPLVRKSSEGKG